MIGADSARPVVPVTLDNWQTAPMLDWTFQHVAEIFATAPVAAGRPTGIPDARQSLGEVPVAHPDGTSTTIAQVMAATDTDGWMLAWRGATVAEEYPRGMGPSTLHLLMSVSKSLVGAVVGRLVDQGAVELQAPVTRYAPELARSGYAGATVDQVLDMRSGIAFSEEYLDPTAEVRVLEQAFGWAPRADLSVPDTMKGYLATLHAQRAHGWPFEYRSCETDVLGWVCEGATGQPFSALMSDLLWTPIGAEFDANIAVDKAGTGMFDGGISAALGDLVRFGLMVAQNGTSITGDQVLAPDWIDAVTAGAHDSRAAFAASPTQTLMPGGMYRRQFWFPGPGSDVVLCLGIHGQLVYIDRRRHVVGAKASSWPAPQDAAKLFATLRAFDAMASALG